MSSLLTSNSESAKNDLVERGQTTYRQRLASILEPSHVGEFVAVEPDSGQYFLGDNGKRGASRRPRRYAEQSVYLTRVGRETAHTVGGHATRIR